MKSSLVVFFTFDENRIPVKWIIVPGFAPHLAVHVAGCCWGALQDLYPAFCYNAPGTAAAAAAVEQGIGCD